MYGVARRDVSEEDVDRVDTEAMGWDDNFIPFKKSVSFVAWESELVDVVTYVNSVLSHHFPPVLEREVIREGEFAQTQKAEKPSDDHGDEEEVVMECRVLVVVNN